MTSLDQTGTGERGGPEYAMTAELPGFADGDGSVDKKGKANSGSDLRNRKAGKTMGRGGLRGRSCGWVEERDFRVGRAQFEI